MTETGQLRLLHIVSSSRWGDTEKYAFDICRYLDSCGADVRVLTKDARAVDINFHSAGLRLVHAPLEGVADWDSISAAGTLIHGTSGDGLVIHVHSLRDAWIAVAARFMARKSPVRIIMSHHNVFTHGNGYAVRKLCNAIDFHIFPSELMRQRFSTFHPEIMQDIRHKSLLLRPSIYNGNEEFEPLPAKGPVAAMFQGELSAGSGLESVIDALSLLGKVKLRLRVVGTGNPDYIDSLRRRAMTRGVMEMIDWTRDTDPFCRLIPGTHFGIVPSVSPDFNSFVNREYMACSRAQISTALGSQREYMTDENEVLFVPPADPPKLAEKMVMLATDQALRERMARNAFDSFNRNLNWNDFIGRLMRVYSGDPLLTEKTGLTS